MPEATLAIVEDLVRERAIRSGVRTRTTIICSILSGMPLWFCSGKPRTVQRILPGTCPDYQAADSRKGIHGGGCRSRLAGCLSRQSLRTR